MPLWSDNSYKTFKEFNADIDTNFIIEKDKMILSVNSSAVVDISESKIEIETAQDYGFQCNQKIIEAN